MDLFQAGFFRRRKEITNIPADALTVISRLSDKEERVIDRVIINWADKINSKEAVLKVLRSSNNERKLHESDEVRTFLRCFERERHPNIIEFLGIVISNNNPLDSRGFVMEYMPGGSLDRVIHNKNTTYNDYQVFSWVEQAASGLQFLHDLSIIHFNVKPSNMLLNANCKQLKISNFRMTKKIGEQAPTGGALEYQAPEILRNEACGVAVDTYALGISTWEMFHRTKPYNDLKASEIPRRVLKSERPFVVDHFVARPYMLLLGCWRDNPNGRWTMRDVVQFTSVTAEYQKQLICFSKLLSAKKMPNATKRKGCDCVTCFVSIAAIFYCFVLILGLLPR